MQYKMIKRLLRLILFSVCFSSCSKSTDVVALIKTQAAIDDKIIVDYLTKKGLPKNVIDTTGVYYVIDTLGIGNDIFTSATQITVGYKGSLLTGTIFTQTDRFHPTYTLGQLIRGWQVGIPQIKQGGTVTLLVPSRNAYGPFSQTQVGIPANSVLRFDIKLYGVTN